MTMMTKEKKTLDAHFRIGVDNREGFHPNATMEVPAELRSMSTSATIRFLLKALRKQIDGFDSLNGPKEIEMEVAGDRWKLWYIHHDDCWRVVDKPAPEAAVATLWPCEDYYRPLAFVFDPEHVPVDEFDEAVDRLDDPEVYDRGSKVWLIDERRIADEAEVALG
jgi:hypothetical protein